MEIVHEPMTHEEYEDKFLEAWNVLKRRILGQFVGDPEQTPSGTRFVRVGSLPCDDKRVFEMAWGKEIADHIMNRRP